MQCIYYYSTFLKYIFFRYFKLFSEIVNNYYCILIFKRNAFSLLLALSWGCWNFSVSQRNYSRKGFQPWEGHQRHTTSPWFVSVATVISGHGALKTAHPVSGELQCQQGGRKVDDMRSLSLSLQMYWQMFVIFLTLYPCSKDAGCSSGDCSRKQFIWWGGFLWMRKVICNPSTALLQRLEGARGVKEMSYN